MTKAQEVLDYCQNQTEKLIARAEALKQLDSYVLQWKQSPTSWNVLECLAHLNLYADFYNSAIQTAITCSSHRAVNHFKSGVLGGYFVKSMLPNQKIKKMNTFKDKNPIFGVTSLDELERFLDQQREFKKLIEQARKIDINKTKTPVTLSKLIRLKLGDTFMFMVNHNIRHFAQIEKCLKEQV